MITLEIPVEKTRIKTPLAPMWASGTPAVRLHFEFSKEWKHYTKKAIGFYRDTESGADWFPLGNNAIRVPDEYLKGDCYIQIVGQWSSERLTTGLSKVRVA